jgi:DNA-binding NarL/FixJ family response regulator
MTTIALVDVNPLIVQQFISHFQNLANIQIVTTAQNIEEFETNLTNKPVLDILFLDINLPNETGLAALPRLKTLLPDTNIIMFTDNEDSDSLLTAFFNGATGYILKNTAIEDLSAYIEIVKKGGSAISAKMAQLLIDALRTDPTLFTMLNEKERQILDLLAEGWSYKLIADKINLSVNGVRFYMKRIYKALNVNSKGEAIHLYYKKYK